MSSLSSSIDDDLAVSGSPSGCLEEDIYEDGMDYSFDILEYYKTIQLDNNDHLEELYEGYVFIIHLSFIHEFEI